MVENAAVLADSRSEHGNSFDQSMTAPATRTAPRIAVAGATGEIGGRVAQLLGAAGVPARLPVRAARRAPRPQLADICEIGSHADRRGIAHALRGIETFLLLPGHGAEARVDAHRAAIEAAVDAGVRRIVQLSLTGAAADATFTYARDHWQTEQDLRASGVEWTIARTNLYLDELPTFVSRAGIISGPAGDGRVAAVARDDVARALAALLTGDEHAGRTYELSGPQALDLHEIAAVLGRSCRQLIRFERQTLEDAVATRAALPATEAERDGWVSSYAAIAAGELAHLSTDIEQLTGQPPMTLERWLRAYPFSLMHVGALL